MSTHPHLNAPTRKVASGPARRLHEALERAGLHDALVDATGAEDYNGKHRPRDLAGRPALVLVTLDPTDARTLASILEAIA